ncbi:MAG: hypothetical protein WCF95_03485 [bacterium]
MDKKLAYLITKQIASGGFLGAILICDTKGFPVEFRYTEPIIPTKIQKVLYGNNLEKYLKVDVILDSLLKVLSSNYDILIVSDDVLLEYKEAKNILKMSTTQNPILSKDDKIQKINNNECLIRIPLSEQPIRLLFQKDFNCEGEPFDGIVAALLEMGESIDISEPLSRVQKSIDLICKREI